MQAHKKEEEKGLISTGRLESAYYNF